MIIPNINSKDIVENQNRNVDPLRALKDASVETNLLDLPNEMLLRFMEYYARDDVAIDLGPVCQKFLEIACLVSNNSIFTKECEDGFVDFSEDVHSLFGEDEFHHCSVPCKEDKVFNLMKTKEIANNITDVILVDEETVEEFMENHYLPAILYCKKVRRIRTGISVIFHSHFDLYGKEALKKMSKYFTNFNTFYPCLGKCKDEIHEAFSCIECKLNQLEYAQIIECFPNTYTLECTKFAKHMRNLKYLNICLKNTSEEEVNQVLQGPKKLSYLRISFFGLLTKSIIKLVSSFPHQLEDLDIIECSINDSVLMTIAARFPSLKGLTLRNEDNVTSLGVNYLVKFCQSLNELHFTNCNQITKDVASTAIKYCSKVHYMDLSGTKVSKLEFESLVLKYPFCKLFHNN